MINDGASSIKGEIDKIKIAAGLKPEHYSSHLFHLIGYRQAIAQAILHESNGIKIEQLEEVFDYVNNDIKRLLGI